MLLTRKRTFYLTCCFEWVLGARVQDQFILVPFVIAIRPELNGGHGFGECGSWLGVVSRLGVRLGQLFVQVLGKLLVLLSLLF